jgi:hypothetical protein
MVRALVAGHETQTRRVAVPPLRRVHSGDGSAHSAMSAAAPPPVRPDGRDPHPQTGKTRRGGKRRLHILGSDVGERVLFWIAEEGWVVLEMTALGDTAIGLHGHGEVAYRDVAGWCRRRFMAETTC